MAKKSAYKEAFKAGFIVRGDAESLTLKRLPIGIPSLDRAIGGGLPIGGITLIAGHESSGKTILCQYAVAAQQEQKTDRKTVLYLDVERSFDREWWEASGVNVKNLLVMRPPSGEQLIDLTAEALQEDKTIGMIVLDSIAAVPPEALMEAQSHEQRIGMLARLMSRFFVKILPLAQDVTVVMTNQLRANIGTHGTSYPGGVYQRYAAHLILQTRRHSWLTERDQRVGYNMLVEVRKNKTAPLWTDDVIIPFRFGSQIDHTSMLIDLGIEQGIIEPRSPYYRVPDDEGEIKSVLGQANLRQHLADNLKVLAQLQELAHAGS